MPEGLARVATIEGGKWVHAGIHLNTSPPDSLYPPRAVYFTVLKCEPLVCTYLLCTVLHFTVLYCTSLHLKGFPSLKKIMLNYQIVKIFYDK